MKEPCETRLGCHVKCHMQGSGTREKTDNDARGKAVGSTTDICI